MVDRAKEWYYKTQVYENKKCPKKLWNTLKQLGVGTTTTKESNIGIDVNGSVVFDKYSESNLFNEFFTTVAGKLVNNLPSPSGKYGKNFVTQFYCSKGVMVNSFQFDIVSLDISMSMPPMIPLVHTIEEGNRD